MYRTQSRPLPHWTYASPRRVWLTLIAATAVLVGMLGMHAVILGSAVHAHTASIGADMSTSAMEDATQVVGAPGQSSVAAATLLTVADQIIPTTTAADDDDCGGKCVMDLCLLVGIMCVMAVLAVALALRARPGTGLLFPLLPSAPPEPLLDQSLAPPRRPSLIALSISRT